ncbi:hypothetical protein ACFRAR_17670 [Kitasatospora sp. NPDC056651]|uniref:hypothetical protein n=1 Tax=Kitasatospora sp. NPDC056651 TaxID=3345892 RepID=UPI00369CC84D
MEASTTGPAARARLLHHLTDALRSLPSGAAETPDGFAFALRQSVQGYLSLHGSTPRFRPGPEEDAPFPDRVDRPAS